jgi:hypothetical protein
MITEAFAIRNQLLSGSDDSIEAMTERLEWARGASPRCFDCPTWLLTSCARSSRAVSQSS